MTDDLRPPWPALERVRENTLGGLRRGAWRSGPTASSSTCGARATGPSSCTTTRRSPGGRSPSRWRRTCPTYVPTLEAALDGLRGHAGERRDQEHPPRRPSRPTTRPGTSLDGASRSCASAWHDLGDHLVVSTWRPASWSRARRAGIRSGWLLWDQRADLGASTAPLDDGLDAVHPHFSLVDHDRARTRAPRLGTRRQRLDGERRRGDLERWRRSASTA